MEVKVGIINVFNPCLLILTGGVIQGLPTKYISMVKDIVRLNALKTSLEDLNIITSALGDKAGVINAAMLARHRFQITEKEAIKE